MFMEKMNAATQSTTAKVILGLVSVSFLLSGVAGYVLHTNDTSVAKVNGEEISQQTFQQQYSNEYQRLSHELGNQFSQVVDSPEFANNLRKSVLNNLINQELLRQYVDKLKLAATDQQITREIVSTPAFQNNGKFDNALYQRSLAENHLTTDAYASYVREGLRLSQLQNGLLGSDFFVPEQKKNLAEGLFQRRQVRLAILPVEAELSKQAVAEEEIKAYYDSHLAEFAIPEQVKIQYLDLSLADLEKNLSISEAEIKKYYQDNIAQFSSMHLAHIQLATLQEAQDVYQALQNGADFAELARTKSLDKPSAANSGDLDWVSAGMLPEQFETVAHNLKVGEYSQPVKIDNAFHIIKVLDRRTQPLDLVKANIENKLRQEQASNKFYALEKLANEKAFENQDSLVAAADAVGIKLKETEFFTRTDVPAGLNFPNVISSIFDSNLTQGGVNSEAINIGEQHSLLFRVLEHKAEGVTSLEEARANIESRLKHQKAEHIVLEQAEKLAQQLNEDKNVSLPVGVTFGQPQTRVYAENKDPMLNDIIFSMDKPQPNQSVYRAAKEQNGNIVLIQLDEVTNGELSDSDMKSFSVQLENAQQQELQVILLRALRDKAKIDINQDFMKQTQE